MSTPFDNFSAESGGLFGLEGVDDSLLADLDEKSLAGLVSKVGEVTPVVTINPIKITPIKISPVLPAG